MPGRTSTSNTTTATSAAGAGEGLLPSQDETLLLAFERSRVDEERRGLEERSIAIRGGLHQDAQDLQLHQEEERQRIERLRSEFEMAKRKLSIVIAENNALVQQIAESDESMDETRKELANAPGSPYRKNPALMYLSEEDQKKERKKATAQKKFEAESSGAADADGSADAAILAQLHVAETRVSSLRGEHSALVQASTEVSKRLRESAAHRDHLSAEVNQLRDLNARLQELNRDTATGEAGHLQRQHQRLVDALNETKERTTAAANERKFLATHLLDGARERAQSLREVRVRCAGGDHASAFLRKVLDENVTMRRKARQAMVDFMDERELLQEYVLVLMARIAEATQRLHRDMHDSHAASELRDAAVAASTPRQRSPQ